MTDVDVQTDLAARTMTITTRLDATVERAWQLWADPRQLERWWGPPGYPATVTDHDLRPDGLVRYFMTGPEGQRHHGLWRVVKVDAPHRLVLEDSFADDEGTANPDMPVSTTDVALEADGDGTRMRIVSRYPTTEALEQVLAMGAADGMRAALAQIDAILAEDR